MAEKSNVQTKAGISVPVNQIFTIVNSVFEQMTGRKDIVATDTASLVAMGKEVDNLGKNDLWLNSVARRIGYTVDEYRVYRNQFADLYRNQFEWGALVQKLTAEMPDAVADKMYDVGAMNGQSIDHYIISNPKVHQKIFDKETPFSFFITIQKKLLKEAFLSETAMAGLLNQIFGKVQNKIEVVLEDLGRTAVNNYMLNTGDKQVYNLVSIYNGLTGNTIAQGMTAMFNADFLRFAIGLMNNVSLKMQTMSTLYNADAFDRFTPLENQRFYMLADFQTQLQTVVQYQAFNEKYVNKAPDIAVPYWQANSNAGNNFGTVSKIMGTTEAGAKTMENVVGILFDFDAIGTFRQEEDVLTTPINARAAYYNTFWHEKQLWFNDMSENGVVFTLN